MTARDSLLDPMLLGQLRTKGINKFGINKFNAFEVPVERVREKYVQHFAVTMGDFRQTDDLRVVDEERSSGIL